jgi:hypothetical protein
MPRVTSDAVRVLALESGQLACHVDILDVTGETRLLSSRDGLPVIGGSVTTDDTADVPGSGTFRLLVPDELAGDVVPYTAGHPLSPIARARVQVSFAAPGDSDSDETRYGRYDIADLDIEEGGEGLALVGQFYDLARRVKRAQFWQPWLVLKGTSYEQALRNMLIGVVDDDLINTTPTGKKNATHWVWDTQDDRLAEIQKVATSVGFRLDFNEGGVGRLGFHPYPDTDEPVATFRDTGSVGPGTCKATKLSRKLSDEKAYNGVVSIGEATGSDKPPVRGEAWDTDPASLTYYDPANPDASSYGPVPYFMVSEYVTTTRQARDAARAQLPKVLGMTDQLSLECLPHPGLVPGDPIRVERPRLGAAGTYVVELVTMPLRASEGRMQVTCRERRVAA